MLEKRYSKYNVVFNHLDSYYLYNSLVNSLWLINKGIFDSIKNNDFTKINEELIKELVDWKIIISSKEEKEFLDKIISTKHYNHDGDINLVVALTTKCNFKCPYCYEYENPNFIQSTITKDKLERFVELIPKISDKKNVVITWFGGEPLLEIEKSLFLKKELEKKGYNIEGGLITNGYYLTNEIIPILEKLNIKSIQVSIDGLKETHDLKKIHNQKKKSFDIVMKNLKNTLENWQGKLVVRINLDKNNIEEYPKILKYLKNEIDKNLDIYSGIIEIKGKNTLTLEEVQKIYLSNHQFLEEKYFFPEPFKICITGNKNMFVIDSNGSFYKCIRDIGNKQMMTGNVGVGLKLEENPYLNISPFYDLSCKECFFYPNCLGGCDKSNYIHIDKRCSIFKDKIIDFLKIYIDKKNYLEKNNKKELILLQSKPNSILANILQEKVITLHKKEQLLIKIKEVF